VYVTIFPKRKNCIGIHIYARMIIAKQNHPWRAKRVEFNGPNKALFVCASIFGLLEKAAIRFYVLAFVIYI
jgi:hypothetical protein